MKRGSISLGMIAAALVLICIPALHAQEVVFNGDFETGSLSPMWTLWGGNQWTIVWTFETVKDQPSLCMRRRPGPPASNGGIETAVHLLGGVLYQFRADIAAQESG